MERKSRMNICAFMKTSFLKKKWLFVPMRLNVCVPNTTRWCSWSSRGKTVRELHLLRSLTNLINMQSAQHKPINDGTNKYNITPNQTKPKRTEPDVDIHKWTHIVVIKCLFYIFVSTISNGCWKVLAYS